MFVRLRFDLRSKHEARLYSLLHQLPVFPRIAARGVKGNLKGGDADNDKNEDLLGRG